MALRITVERLAENESRVRLEGRISAREVGLLDACLAELNGQALALDLTGLRWIDPGGVARLTELVRAGARIDRTSAFVDGLLACSERDSPSPTPSATHAPGERRP